MITLSSVSKHSGAIQREMSGQLECEEANKLGRRREGGARLQPCQLRAPDGVLPVVDFGFTKTQIQPRKDTPWTPERSLSRRGWGC
jgi:hypothetical protein